MKRDHALVIGAGTAGLAAAQVLSEHFKKVTVLEKDPSIGSNNARSGVPQGRHLHVLLKRGHKILRQLFPKIEKDFEDCPYIDWSHDTAWENRDGLFPRYPSLIRTEAMSRPRLESHMHFHVSQKSRIVFHKAEVEEIFVEQNTVESVRCKNNRLFTADLVVIAGGAFFPLKRLLPTLSIDGSTKKTSINITYRSVQFTKASLKFQDFKQYYYQLSPPTDARGAVIAPIENGRYVATLIEYSSSLKGKADFEDFMKRALLVPGKHCFSLLKDGQALGEPAYFHKSHMHLRRLHKVAGFPVNLVVVGDAFCSLNPVFGQGMTVALEQALLLKKMLSQKYFTSRKFHSDAEALLRVPYLLSKLGSETHPSFTKRYLENYLHRCQESSKLHLRFLKTLHLEGSVFDLLDFTSFIKTLLGRHS